MAAVGMTLLLVGASVALSVEQVRGVSDPDVEVFLSQLATSVADKAGRQTLRDRGGDECTSDDRCADQIRGRSGADEVLFVRLIGVPSRIRIVAERVSPAGGVPRRATIDLTRNQSSWASSLDGLALNLFPDPPADARDKREDLGYRLAVASQAQAAEPPAAPPAPTAAAAPPEAVRVEAQVEAEAEGGSVWPWVLIGSSVAVTGVGVYFGVKSQQARDDGTTQALPGDQVDDYNDRIKANGLAANILWGTAGAMLTAGIVWLILD